MMTSVVNGGVHGDESATKMNNDDLDSEPKLESKSTSKLDGVQPKDPTKEKDDNISSPSQSQEEKSEKETSLCSINQTSEGNDLAETTDLLNKKEIPTVSDTGKPLIENGINCSKEEACEKFLSASSEKTNSNDTSCEKSSNAENCATFIKPNDTSEVKKTDEKLLSTEDICVLNTKVKSGEENKIKSNSCVDDKGSSDMEIISELQHKDGSNKNEHAMSVKSLTVREMLKIERNQLPTAKTNNLASGRGLDLSITKDFNNAQVISSDKINPLESNPLEKLNEHLNSIGCDSDLRPPKQNITQKDTLSLAQKSDYQSCNKENKNITSHSYDRFKESPENFVFAELSNEETGFPEAFSGLVKIGRYISVKGDFTLRSTEALVESPSLVSSYLLKEPDTFPPKDKESKSEPRDFFHSAAGEILIGIGLSRVNEWYHKDMIRVKKRQMKKDGKRPQIEEELAAHENSYVEAKKANNVYSCSYKACKTCGFTTESLIVLEGHLLVPHVTQRREYQCNFCENINRDPKAMLDHMEKVHQKIGRIQPPVLFFECPYCTFESNSKVKLNNHLVKCQRYFDHGVNQAPPRDFEFPALTPKPITVAVVKAYEKSLCSIQRGRGRPKKQDNLADSSHINQYIQPVVQSPVPPNTLSSFKPNSNSPLADSLSIQNQIMSPIQMSSMNIRPAHSNSVSQGRPGIPPIQLPPANRFYQVVNPGQMVPVGNNHLSTSPSQFPFASNMASNNGKKLSASGSPFINSSIFGSGARQQNSKFSPEIPIASLPKLTGPYPVPMAKQAVQPGGMSMVSNNSLVVCEICDGYIKDLDQLRTHMQLIHKVKIHPKMLASRPPLNCQKCQWRFFTDQGLERHLLGAHGLVTSNMQELANKNKDAGCCTICGRVYASKLVSHMNQVHKVTLKPAHLSYKCTVCSATFNLYRLFENHVYLVHSGAAKRSSESGRSSPSKKLKTISDKGDSMEDEEPTNHKRQSKDNGEEIFKICIECGDDILSKKPDCKKCEKCLKSDELVQGTLITKTLKDELRKKDKIEKAAY